MKRLTSILLCAFFALSVGMLFHPIIGATLFFGAQALALFGPALYLDNALFSTPFAVKTSAEVGEMTDEQRAEYVIGFLNSKTKPLEDEIESLKSKLESEGENEDLKEALESLEVHKNELIALKEIVKQQGAIIAKGLKNNDSKEPKKGLKHNLSENLDALKALKKAKTDAGLTPISVKVPGNMTIADSITGPDAERLPIPEYLPGLILIPERRPFIKDFTDTTSTDRAVIVWTEESNPEGDFEFTAEGGVKPLLDWENVPYVTNARKVAGVIKVSKEMVDDIDYMANEINRRLRAKHDLKEEDGILNGDGVDPNLLGITVQAPAFIPGNLAGDVPTPNNMDVLRGAIKQIVVSSDGLFYPTAIFVNPDDAAKMDLEKGGDGQYVLPPFMSTDGTVIKGVRVFEQTKIPADKYLIGDFTRCRVRVLEAFNIEIGWENDDFRNNLRTIIGESRLHSFIPNNELTAFVYGTFSTDKLAIEKP